MWIEKFGFPSDLTLSPREMVQLYDTMFEFWKSCLRAQVNSNSAIVFELITVDGNCIHREELSPFLTVCI